MLHLGLLHWQVFSTMVFDGVGAVAYNQNFACWLFFFFLSTLISLQETDFHFWLSFFG